AAAGEHGLLAWDVFFDDLEFLLERARYAWRRNGGCGRFDAWERAHAVENPIDLLHEPRHISQLRPTRAHSKGQYPARLESEIDARKLLEAAQKQAGACE